MPIQFPNYERLSFAEANPWLSGLQAAQNAIQVPFDIQAKIAGTRLNELEGKKAEAELPYAGQMAKSTAAYKEAMAKYLMMPNQQLRHLSGLGKTFIEPAVIDAILASRGVKNTSPGQGFEYTPSNDHTMDNTGMDQARSESSINDAYNLQRLKQTTDTDTRKRNLFATNIDKTISYINPQALTQYGGIKGQWNKGIETIKSAFGKESPQYDEYVKSANAVKLLTKQIRQFYGDSIQPSVQENLEKLNNPSTWSNNPQLAKQLLEQTMDILGNELGTYREALQSPAVYKGEKSQYNAKNISKEMRKTGSDKLAKSLKMPTFKNREEAMAWFNRQPKITQDAIRKNLRGNQ